MSGLFSRHEAPIWRRCIARLLDAATAFMILMVLVVTQWFWFVGPLTDRVTVGAWGDGLIVRMAFGLVAVTYDFVFLKWSCGQTPGHDVLNIRVVAATREAEELSNVQLLWRAALITTPWVLPQLWMSIVAFALGVGMAALTPSLIPIDRLTRTRVVEYDRSVEDPDAPPKAGFLRRTPPRRNRAGDDHREPATSASPAPR